MNDLQNASPSTDHAHDLLTLPSAPGRLACLRALERKVLWLSTWMIHNANHLRPSRDGLKVGGHQASCASLVTLMTGALLRRPASPGPGCRQAACQPGLPRDPVPARARSGREKLERFRAFGGAQSYPSRTKDGDDVDFSTGSVGLGVAMTLSPRWSQDYLRLKRLVPDDRPAGRMIALAGDAELDEGNVFEALLEGWKHDVRNVWWIIDYNRQSLDSVVEDRLFQRIDSHVPVDGLGGRDAEVRPPAPGGFRAARRRGAAGLDRQLPQLALLGPGLPRRRRLARAG